MDQKARISSNGQVSIPAAVRKRWKVRDVVVFDEGDHVVVRPVPSRATLRGKWRDRLPTTEEMRAADRHAPERA